MTLEQMKSVDIRTVDLDTLVDAANVEVDMALPPQERMRQSAQQLKNPYCFKCGGVAVKINHTDTTATINDRMESYLRTI